MALQHERMRQTTLVSNFSDSLGVSAEQLISAKVCLLHALDSCCLKSVSLRRSHLAAEGFLIQQMIKAEEAEVAGRDSASDCQRKVVDGLPLK